jgi:hypothetical protein
MQKLWFRACIVLVLLLTTVSLYAQETEEELPEIPYFKSSSSFNVPILQLESWDNQHTEDDAIYVNESLNAQIRVTAVRTMNDIEAIQTAIAAVYAGDLPAPFVESRIALLNSGTWTQQLFFVGDTSISAFAYPRSDRTFVILLVEDNPDYMAHQFMVRSPITGNDADGEPITDFAGGVDLAVQEFLGEGAAFTLENSTDLTALGLPSVENTYTTDAGTLTVFAQELGGITYATITTSDIATAEQIGEAVETVFLGFFVTPDNTGYLYLGLTMVALIFGALIGSMYLRYRNLQKDMALVKELADK